MIDNTSLVFSVSRSLRCSKETSHIPIDGMLGRLLGVHASLPAAGLQGD